jgi:hypothetical protein
MPRYARCAPLAFSEGEVEHCVEAASSEPGILGGAGGCARVGGENCLYKLISTNRIKSNRRRRRSPSITARPNRLDSE